MVNVCTDHEDVRARSSNPHCTSNRSLSDGTSISHTSPWSQPFPKEDSRDYREVEKWQQAASAFMRLKGWLKNLMRMRAPSDGPLTCNQFHSWNCDHMHLAQRYIPLAYYQDVLPSLFPLGRESRFSRGTIWLKRYLAEALTQLKKLYLW